jgi:hypothetical protein
LWNLTLCMTKLKLPFTDNSTVHPKNGKSDKLRNFMYTDFLIPDLWWTVNISDHHVIWTHE